MGLGANLLVTQLAWTAGHKALNYLPENWKNKISGSRSENEITDFLLQNRAQQRMFIEIFQSGDTIAKLNNDGEVEATSPSYQFKYATDGNPDWFYTKADDLRGGAGYTCMYLRVQGTETIMEIPCVDGCPEIEMNVIQNEMPTASNELVTTNRRVKPLVFRFRFPIAYLRIYGENNASKETTDVRNSLQKAKDKLMDKINDVKSSVMEKLGIEDDNDIAYDPDIGQGNEVMERSIPTYSQVLGTLIQFPRQFGCYLYMGFGFTKIGVTCSMKLTSQKGDMDCIWVDMTLTETMEFDFENLTTIKVSDWQNTTSTTSSNVSGNKVNDNATGV